MTTSLYQKTKHTPPKLASIVFPKQGDPTSGYSYYQEQSATHSNHRLVNTIAGLFEKYCSPLVFRHPFVTDVPLTYPHYAIHIPSSDALVTAAICDLGTFDHAAVSSLAGGLTQQSWHIREKCTGMYQGIAQGTYTFVRNATPIPVENALVRIYVFNKFSNIPTPPKIEGTIAQSIAIDCKGAFFSGKKK